LVIHCQVITSQVMAYQPDRDRPVIGRPVPRTVGADRRWRRKVILTTLSVKGRYFGGVTARAGRKPARAGHEPAVPVAGSPAEGRPLAGPGPGPASGRMSRAGMRQGDHSGRPAPAAAAARQLGPGPLAVYLIGLAVLFTRWPADPVPMHWRDIPCRPLIVGWRDYASVLPDCRSGLADRPPAGVPGRSGRPGRASWPRRARRPRWSVSRPQRLFSCPARPPAAGGTTNRYLSRPQRCSASMRLIT